jgi:hypothetical protein
MCAKLVQQQQKQQKQQAAKQASAPRWGQQRYLELERELAASQRVPLAMMGAGEAGEAAAGGAGAAPAARTPRNYGRHPVAAQLAAALAARAARVGSRSATQASARCAVLERELAASRVRLALPGHCVQPRSAAVAELERELSFLRLALWRPGGVARVISRTVCAQCGLECASRTALFAHLRAAQHGVMPAVAPLLALILREDGWRHFAREGEAERAVAAEAEAAPLRGGPYLDSGEPALLLAAARHALAAVSGAADQAAAAWLRLVTVLVARGGTGCARRNREALSLWSLPPLVAPVPGEEGEAQAQTAVALARNLRLRPLLEALLCLPPLRAQEEEECAVHLEAAVWCCKPADARAQAAASEGCAGGGGGVGGGASAALPSSLLVSLTGGACAHRCCRAAAVSWLAAQAEDGSGFEQLRCIACAAPVPHATAVGLLRDGGGSAGRRALGRVERNALEAALASTPDFVWCPRCPSGGLRPEAPGCGECTCDSCGLEYCLKCRCAVSLHARAGVAAGAEGCASAVGEMLSRKWLDENTKQCPNPAGCGAHIEKISGCSHMRCRACRFEWCWVCRGKYQGRYTCNAGEMRAGKCPCKK